MIWFSRLCRCSGRSGSTYYLTREWLKSHGFPPGLILHTDKHAPTLPLYSSVGLFKRDLINMLKQLVGMRFGGLYGALCLLSLLRGKMSNMYFYMRHARQHHD